MNIVDLSLKRPIMVSMALVACIIFGVMAYFSIPLMLIPDAKLPYVTVQTIYAGASPDVIENQITKKVEDATSSISEIEQITSYSLDSASMVMIQFKFSKDENLALQEVKDKVEAIQNELPTDAKKPVISKVNVATLAPIMNIILEGDMSPSELYTFASETVSDRIAQIPGVGSVTISGGEEREIRVNLKSSTIYERSVPITQIAQIVAAANVDLPGGNVTYENRDIPVQLKGKFTDLDALSNLDIPTTKGVFKLHQLADVSDTSKTARQRTIFFDNTQKLRNENAILLQIAKNPSGNTVEVVEGIQALLPEIESMGGGHISFNVINEDATFVHDTVNDTLSNVYLGVILTALVLLFFLHDWRSTIIVAISMPFSIIATFFLMKSMGISFNLLSLTGISAATGTLVANSVVVLENVFRYKREGLDRRESASVGTTEVLVAVFASTLTNIAVFLPLATIQSSIGDVLKHFSFSTVIATVFSIIVSFTLTPMLCAKILPEKIAKPGKVGRAIDAMFTKLENSYKSLLAVAIRNKATSIAVILGSFGLLIVTLSLAGNLGFELMPATDGGKISIDVELAQGTDIERTAEVFKVIEDRLSAYDEVQKIVTQLGKIGSTSVDVSLGKINVYLNGKKLRDRSSGVLAAQFAEDLSDIPGATIAAYSISELSFSGVKSGLDMYLKGSDQAQLQTYAEQIKEILNHVDGFANVALSSKSGKQELDFVPNRQNLSLSGLTVQEVAITMRAAIEGLEITKYKEGSSEYDVRVTIDNESIKDIDDIRNIPIVARNGIFPLSHFADVSFQNSTNMIMRVDKTRVIEITADVLPGHTLGTLQAQAMVDINKIDMRPGYSLASGGTNKMMNDTFHDLAIAFATAILVIYMLLAATLEDLKQPLYILSTVPLSIIGVILSALMTGTAMNLTSMLGVIMLVGIVVNNAILILDQYNILRREKNMKVSTAMTEACGTKLKAILMSNIAIILGQLPMALGIGASGAEMRQPMGIVIVGGILSSTIMTLFVVPALEKFFANEDGKKKFGLLKIFKKQKELPASDDASKE